MVIIGCLCVSVQNGATALIMAAQEGHLKVVEKLIASGAEINHQNKVSCLCISCGVGVSGV